LHNNFAQNRLTTPTKKLILKIAFVSIRIHTKAAPIKNKHFLKHTQNKKTTKNTENSSPSVAKITLIVTTYNQ
jgi:hypothetical protein